MRVLVTGGTGFVGGHVVRRLLGEGFEVRALVRPGSRIDELLALDPAPRLAEHDGTTEGLVSLLSDSPPDLAIHIASTFVRDHRPEDVEPLVRSNLLLPAQLLEAMRVAGCRRLLNVGSAWQHFESDGYRPVCLYAATKEAAEKLIDHFVLWEGFATIHLKLFDTYGPGDPRRKLFTVLAEAAGKDEPLAMSPGEQMVDLVHVRDVAAAFLVAARRLLADEVEGAETYAVSSGKPIRLKDLVAEYSRRSGWMPKIEWGGRPYHPREVMRPWTGGETLPGWAPEVGLEEGLGTLGVEGCST